MAHLNCQSLKNKLDLVKYHINSSDLEIFSLYLGVWEGIVYPKKEASQFVKNEVHYSAKDFEDYNTSCDLAELLWLKRPGGLHSLPPPSPNGTIKEFTALLTEMVNEICCNYRMEIYILGDFNIDYLDSNSLGRKYLKEFESLTEMKQYLTGPIRFATKNSTIDLIYMYSNSEFIREQGTKHWNISDHEAVYINRKRNW